MENTIRTYAEAVDITVKWWSNKAFDTPLNQNNGDNSSGGSMVFLLMNLASQTSNNEVTPQKRQKFEDKLKNLLLEGENKPRYARECDVDYNPNQILQKACDYSEINTMVLPCKTFTVIEKDNTVHGRYQYGGEWFVL